MTVLKATLPVSFYKRPTLQAAPDLLGCVLNRRFSSDLVKQSLITEVEAYTQDDPACHAFRGLTRRNEVLFGDPGMAYVYFIYGMYHCLNVVTEVSGVAGAVLIRGLSEPGLDGPGKICRAWLIDRSHNGLSLMDSTQELWIGPRPNNFSAPTGVSKRIGITQPTAKEFPWRFFILPDQKHVGRKKGKSHEHE